MIHIIPLNTIHPIKSHPWCLNPMKLNMLNHQSTDSWTKKQYRLTPSPDISGPEHGYDPAPWLCSSWVLAMWLHHPIPTNPGRSPVARAAVAMKIWLMNLELLLFQGIDLDLIENDAIEFFYVVWLVILQHLALFSWVWNIAPPNRRRNNYPGRRPQTVWGKERVNADDDV